MDVSAKYHFDVSSDGKTLYKGNNAKALSIAGRVYYKLASQTNQKGSKAFKSAAEVLRNHVEKAIALALGGTTIDAKKGLGFQPDFFVETADGGYDERELKLSILSEMDGELKRKGAIKIGGGSGFKINNSQTQEIVTGYTYGKDDEGNRTYEEAKEYVDTRHIYRELKKANNNSDKIKKILSGKNTSAELIRTNIILKAKNIDIPFYRKNAVEVRSLKFTWKNLVQNKGIKFTANYSDPDTVKLQVSISQGFINKAFKNIEVLVLDELQNGKVGVLIAEAIAEMAMFLNSDQVSGEVKKFIDSLGFGIGLNYVVGSVVLSAGLALARSNKRYKRAKTKSKQDSFSFSDIEISAIVRKEVDKRMPDGRGDLTGPAMHPTILTYRTGTFVASINVIQKLDNAKQNMFMYYYAPNYLKHELSRPPSVIIESSIALIVRRYYNKKFTIYRSETNIPA